MTIDSFITEAIDMIKVEKKPRKSRLDPKEYGEANDVDKKIIKDKEKQNAQKTFYELMTGLYCLINEIDIQLLWFKEKTKGKRLKRFILLGKYKVSNRKMRDDLAELKYRDNNKKTAWIRSINKKIKLKIQKDIKFNVVTRSIYITLMVLPSAKDTFISKLRNGRYTEITADEKLAYLTRVAKELKAYKATLPEKDLQEYTDYFSEIEGTDLSSVDRSVIEKLYEKYWEDEISNRLLEIYDDIIDNRREEYYINRIVGKVRRNINDIYTRKPYENIPFPSTINGHLISTSIFPGEISYIKNTSVLSDFGTDEKEYLLELLEKMLCHTLDEWKSYVLEAVNQKRDDPNFYTNTDLFNPTE